MCLRLTESFISCRKKKPQPPLNFYTAILQSHCGETGISICRDCSLSMVRLESHFAEIIWYWDVADILYGMSCWGRAFSCAESPIVFLHVGIEVGKVGDAKACHGLADVLLGGRVVRTDCHHWCGIIVQCCNSPVSCKVQALLSR